MAWFYVIMLIWLLLQKSFRSCGETVALRVLPKNFGDGEIGRTVDTSPTHQWEIHQDWESSNCYAILHLLWIDWESSGSLIQTSLLANMCLVTSMPWGLFFLLKCTWWADGLVALVFRDKKWMQCHEYVKTYKSEEPIKVFFEFLPLLFGCARGQGVQWSVNHPPLMIITFWFPPEQRGSIAICLSLRNVTWDFHYFSTCFISVSWSHRWGHDPAKPGPWLLM